ncbi:hypothetical protein CCACVL1_29584 [Corchorus capsularis]|uniref:Uncharacterized protein n=1 Tax=Corchorus capsularis TaxID=210143 RepID=A0A1R3G155_COCAP|nr:hypothetical protein CCACVL1_29584 [Corchorus capsularis]
MAEEFSEEFAALLGKYFPRFTVALIAELYYAKELEAADLSHCNKTLTIV